MSFPSAPIEPNEEGMALIQRALKDIYLRLDGGSNDLNASDASFNQATVNADPGEVDLSGYLQNDLSNISDVDEARTNLGLPFCAYAGYYSGSYTNGAVINFTQSSVYKTFDQSNGSYSSGSFTVPTTGYYLISVSGNNGGSGGSSTNTSFSIAVRIDGSAFAGSSGSGAIVLGGGTTAVLTQYSTNVSCTGMYYLQSGEVITVTAAGDSDYSSWNLNVRLGVYLLSA